LTQDEDRTLFGNPLNLLVGTSNVDAV